MSAPLVHALYTSRLTCGVEFSVTQYLLFILTILEHALSTRRTSLIIQNQLEQHLSLSIKECYLNVNCTLTECLVICITVNLFSLRIRFSQYLIFRLSHSILLGDLTEVPIPTRFIFLLLCPDHSLIDHVEVGRAASTLFSDEVKHCCLGGHTFILLLLLTVLKDIISCFV